MTQKNQSLQQAKQVNEMTRAELEAVPQRKWDQDLGPFDSLVILPERRMHDSGYRCLSFVAVRKGEPMARLSGCSDVINLDGIGGYGDWRGLSSVPTSISPKGWSIDCLPKSGLLQLFCRGKLRAGLDLSSFELYAEVKK